MKKLLYLVLISLFIFHSCSSNEEIDLKENGITLYSGDKYTIKLNSDTKVIYQSDNEYIATVSDKGVITAERIGETSILLDNGKDKKTFNLKVVPKYDLYPTPELDFGISKSDLKTKLGPPEREDENTITYKDYSDAAPFVTYEFDNTGLLISLSIMVKTSYSKDIIAHLHERYKRIETEDETFVFMDGLTQETAKTDIMAKVIDSDYWEVKYMAIRLVNRNSVKPD